MKYKVNQIIHYKDEYGQELIGKIISVNDNYLTIEWFNIISLVASSSIWKSHPIQYPIGAFRVFERNGWIVSMKNSDTNIICKNKGL